MEIRTTYVHAKQTSDQIEGHKNRRKKRNLAQNLVNPIAAADMVDVNLGEVIVMHPAKQLLAMRKIIPHRDNVVLDIRKIQSHVAARSNFVALVAALRESFDDVGFAAEQTQERHVLLPALADALQDLARVFGAGREDLIFDCVNLELDVMHEGIETVDDIVDEGVGNPVGAELHVVPQLPDTLEHVAGVRILGAEGEAQETVAEDDGIDVDRLEKLFALLVLVETAEGDEVVFLEQLDLLAAFLGADILARQGMDSKGLAQGGDFVLGSVQSVKPPATTIRAEGEEILKCFTFSQETSNGGAVNGIIKVRREECPPALVDIWLAWAARGVDTFWTLRCNTFLKVCEVVIGAHERSSRASIRSWSLRLDLGNNLWRGGCRHPILLVLGDKVLEFLKIDRAMALLVRLGIADIVLSSIWAVLLGEN